MDEIFDEDEFAEQGYSLENEAEPTDMQSPNDGDQVEVRNKLKKKNCCKCSPCVTKNCLTFIVSPTLYGILYIGIGFSTYGRCTLNKRRRRWAFYCK